MDLQKVLTETEHLLSLSIPMTASFLESNKLGNMARSEYEIHVESSSKLVQIIYKDIIIASSIQTLMVQESFHIPAFYIPLKDARVDLMRRSCYRTYCPFKGYASYWSLQIGKKTIENAILGYEEPFDKISIIKGYITLNWKQLCCWYKDDESLFIDVIEPIWIGSNVRHAP